MDLIRGREPNNHHQVASIVEPSICESTKEPLEEKLHSHCLIDDNLSQYSNYPNRDSDFDYVFVEEEKVEINQISVEEQSCGHIVVEDQVCEDDKEARNEHIDIFPYQMNDDDHLSLVEYNEQSKEEQPHDDDILVSELDLERSLSHLSS